MSDRAPDGSDVRGEPGAQRWRDLLPGLGTVMGAGTSILFVVAMTGDPLMMAFAIPVGAAIGLLGGVAARHGLGG